MGEMKSGVSLVSISMVSLHRRTGDFSSGGVKDFTSARKINLVLGNTIFPDKKVEICREQYNFFVFSRVCLPEKTEFP